MNSKRIMFIVNCLDIGGAEVQVMRLAVGMIKRAWQVSVVSLIPLGPLAQPLRESGAEVFTLGMRPGIPNPTAILRLRRIIRRVRPEVVHSHIIHANILARITRLFAPVPVLVCTAHNLVESGRVLESCYRYTDRLGDLLTNVSQAAVDRYVEIGAAPKERIRFMPNGLDLAAFPCDPVERVRLRKELACDDRFVWLAVGRFRVQKDYPNMLRAFAAASADRPERSVLLIAGSGPTEHEARQLAEALKLNDRVRFLGIRTDVPALMNMADAFLLSSAWEGMPLVLQEAAASKLPIVATDVGGNREVALDGKSAFLVPARDASALAGAMRRMTDLSPEQRLAMARAGFDHVVSHYDIDRVLDRWESIYQEMGGRVAAGKSIPRYAASGADSA
jgi:glycosyltransferase involved in cell wall biosynthesis